VEKHPDQRVHAAFRLVFQQFAALRRARQVLLWFRQAQLALPALPVEAPWGDPPLRLSGRALILGASSGFGEATALALAGAGMSIVGVHLEIVGS